MIIDIIKSISFYLYPIILLLALYTIRRKTINECGGLDKKKLDLSDRDISFYFIAFSILLILFALIYLDVNNILTLESIISIIFIILSIIGIIFGFSLLYLNRYKSIGKNIDRISLNK